MIASADTFGYQGGYDGSTAALAVSYIPLQSILLSVSKFTKHQHRTIYATLPFLNLRNLLQSITRHNTLNIAYFLEIHCPSRY